MSNEKMKWAYELIIPLIIHLDANILLFFYTQSTIIYILKVIKQLLDSEKIQ